MTRKKLQQERLKMHNLNMIINNQQFLPSSKDAKVSKLISWVFANKDSQLSSLTSLTDCKPADILESTEISYGSRSQCIREVWQLHASGHFTSDVVNLSNSQWSHSLLKRLVALAFICSHNESCLSYQWDLCEISVQVLHLCYCGNFRQPVL